jgi:hypothetical protein
MATMQRKDELKAKSGKVIDQFDDLLLELGMICEQSEHDLVEGHMTWERLGTLQHYVATIRQMIGKVD